MQGRRPDVDDVRSPMSPIAAQNADYFSIPGTETIKPLCREHENAQ